MPKISNHYSLATWRKGFEELGTWSVFTPHFVNAKITCITVCANFWFLQIQTCVKAIKHREDSPLNEEKHHGKLFQTCCYSWRIEINTPFYSWHYSYKICNPIVLVSDRRIFLHNNIRLVHLLNVFCKKILVIPANVSTNDWFRIC